MTETDIAIVGGGLAGSLAAAMLGRAGIDAVVVDPHVTYPDDFRCEKLDPVQLRALELTGIAEPVLRNSTPDRESWVARYGHLVERRPGDQRGIFYDRLVNTIRGQIPAGAFRLGKVAGIALSGDRQTVTLTDGSAISARLVILASGLNFSLRESLGIRRQVISPDHSISVGFDVTPASGSSFPFDSLTYYAERPADRMAYLTLFPIGSTMRGNLFGYRGLDDAWVKQLRQAPKTALLGMWPRLRDIMDDFDVPGAVRIRPVDLYVTRHHALDGLVLVGDAFATSCPAAGTGARKVLVDVERLCNHHIPGWLGTPGMEQAKLAAFYADPVKRACDTRCRDLAFSLRAFSTSRSPRWAAERRGKFLLQAGRGLLRRWSGQPDRTPSGLAPAE